MTPAPENTCRDADFPLRGRPSSRGPWPPEVSHIHSSLVSRTSVIVIEVLIVGEWGGEFRSFFCHQVPPSKVGNGPLRPQRELKRRTQKLPTHLSAHTMHHRMSLLSPIFLNTRSPRTRHRGGHLCHVRHRAYRRHRTDGGQCDRTGPDERDSRGEPRSNGNIHAHSNPRRY